MTTTPKPAIYDAIKARDAASVDAAAAIQAPGDTYHRRGVDRRRLIEVVEKLAEPLGSFANVDCATWCGTIRGEVHDCDIEKARAALALLTAPEESRS